MLATLGVSITLHASTAALMRREALAHGSASASVRTIQVDVDAPEDRDATPAVPPESLVLEERRLRGPRMQSPAPVVMRTTARAPAKGVTMDEPARLESEPVRFVLPNPIATTVSSRSTALQLASPKGQDAVAAVPEDRVSVPARLIARAAVEYPPAARANEIETDVRVEIVVDTSGQVAVVRCLTSVGYGLDQAAVRAVRAYRFSPALLDGRPVRVRMLWMVQFRLG